jgi:hypothetical protein
MARQTDGNETWRTLREWIKGSAAAERLAALILKADGFSSIDPSHPLGGPDGIKDILCAKEGKRWVAGAYFPRGQKSFSDIKDKFLSDSRGKDQNNVDAFAFVSNQELTLSERDGLRSALDFPVEIYHLERLSLLLNSPGLYGVRLEFLDIEMTKEEQLAFIADRDRAIQEIQEGIRRIESQVDTSSRAKTVSPQFESPISGFGFLVGRKLVNCKHCGYGFRISTSYRLIGASALLGKATIACPSCGHIEEAENY